MATARSSTFYTANVTNAYLADVRKGGPAIGKKVAFEATTVSAITADSYKIGTLPANCRMVDLICKCSASLGASAGVASAEIGDSGAAARYMASTAFATADSTGALAAAGSGYTPTADTIVVLTLIGAGTAGVKFSGWFEYIPAN